MLARFVAATAAGGAAAAAAARALVLLAVAVRGVAVQVVHLKLQTS